MEISLLKVLLTNISRFFHLASDENQNLEPIHKYYQKIEEILKLLKPVLDATIDAQLSSDESLLKLFAGLGQLIDELREQFENAHLLMSKVYFVLQVESLIKRIQTSGLEIFGLLKSSDLRLPGELSAASLELCIQKLKHIGYEQTSPIIAKAIRDQEEGSGPSSDSLAKITECLSLRSNQELLIEAVALEKLKEHAEQAENNSEVDYIEQMIALVIHMHDLLVNLKLSQSCNRVPIPPDFCCPLSLELMTDPVIVASGQTYERAFIRKWIDLGLTVCPKTRQTLSHINLIPNYTVKALIANWCETNNVKLPDPVKSMNSNLPSSLLKHVELHSFPQSIGFQTTSADSTWPQQGTSPSHPRSYSVDSLSGVAGNSHEFDNVTIGLRKSGERSSNSPTRKEFSTADEEPSQVRHKRTSSVSSTRSNSNHSEEMPDDGNEVSSGEVPLEPQPATTTPRRLETRSASQSIWRRPSDRFVPRIFSSPAMETRADLSGVETQVKSLVEDLTNTSLDAQRTATAELRLLAKHNMDNRIVIANCGAIPLLIGLLRSTDIKIQENAVTALLNLSLNDNNKTAIANANAIEPLIYVLETGSPEAKENSAATLFSLSVIEDNKIKIGRSGAIQPLVDLLGNGTPRGKKDAATALFNLSIYHENKARIVQAGAVKYLVELMDPTAGLVDKAVAVLSNLATIPEGRAGIGQEAGIPVLVEVVELGSARGKENAAAALLQLCTNSSRYCNMVLQEGAVPPLVALSQTGTPRAREKAQALLSYFRNQRHGNGGRG